MSCLHLVPRASAQTLLRSRGEKPGHAHSQSILLMCIACSLHLYTIMDEKINCIWPMIAWVCLYNIYKMARHRFIFAASVRIDRGSYIDYALWQ